MKVRKNYNIAPDDAPENFRYLVEEFSGQDESIQTTKFLTLEDANDWAWGAWNHLTPHEQKRDRVSVVYVEKTTDYYLQEDLDEDWSWVNYSSADTPDGAFDSDEL
mgnify:CR=1 FL=1|jgi:hypothetical protein